LNLLSSFDCMCLSLSLIQFCDYFANLHNDPAAWFSLQLESDLSVFGTFRLPL
jgi:hypothetical protein